MVGAAYCLDFRHKYDFLQLSVQTTNVANTLIIATAPLFAAILSVIFLKERIRLGRGLRLICFLAAGLVFWTLNGGHLSEISPP